ncbi:hypothetical protein L9F63_020672, partial [Diploptera punctata]
MTRDKDSKLYYRYATARNAKSKQLQKLPKKNCLTKITEVVLSLRILGNSLPILRKRQLSCMTGCRTLKTSIMFSAYATGDSA